MVFGVTSAVDPGPVAVDVLPLESWLSTRCIAREWMGWGDAAMPRRGDVGDRVVRGSCARGDAGRACSAGKAEGECEMSDIAPGAYAWKEAISALAESNCSADSTCLT
jgi:hypothetical protein